jgi:hypothetical protein
MTTGQFPRPREVEQHPLAEVMRQSLATNGNQSVKQGTVGVISGELARYSMFSMSLINMLSYSGELVGHFDWLIGSNITGNCNELCKRMEGDWVWMIGDDHAFLPDIVERLVLHDVDVVAPLCLQRASPYPHVVYEGEDFDAEQGTHILHRNLPKEGLHEVYAVGGAGLLVKKHVLEAIGDPYFETFGKQNEDLEFCRKIRNAGFKIHVDCSTLLGHIGNMIVWPHWNEQEEDWGIRLNVGNDTNGPHNVFLKRVMAALAPA